MKLFVLTFCVLVLVALANTKPCSGPRCKRMSPYGDYDYGDTTIDKGDPNGEDMSMSSHGRPIGGITNENTPKRNRGHRRGYNYDNSGTYNGVTNGEDYNADGHPIGGVTNENTPKRNRGHRRGYDYDNPGTNNGDTNGEDYNGSYGGLMDDKNENEPNRSDCPNCYAYGFGNGGYNHNTINIEKK